jgi:hypothetical protein
MTRTLIGITLVALLLSSTVPVWAGPPAGPLAQGSSASNSFGDPGDAYLEFSISGGDLKLREGTPASYEGPWNGGPITLSGKMIVDRTNGTTSWVTMSANVGDQSFLWPPQGQDNRVEGRVESQSFNLVYNVPPDYEGAAVTGSARLEVCGGVCGVYAVDFAIDLSTIQATEEPAPTNASAPSPAPAGPTPTPCPKLSAEKKLAQILDLYSTRIPKGRVSTGAQNNILDALGYTGYSDFVCGGYQSQVLAFLDGLKFSADPCEQALLDDWDYGPIQSFGGYHQAVVLYPRGTTWLETGLVLDPWITQSPKVYSMSAWATSMGGPQYHGVSGSEEYTAQPQYPTVGGSYTPPGSPSLTKEETAFIQSLPPEKQEVFRKMSRQDQKRWLRAAMSGRTPLRKVMADCPLNFYLVSPDGARSGFPGGQPLAELDDVTLGRLPLSDGTYWTVLEYPENAGYTLVLEGTGSGQAYVVAGDGVTVEPQRSPAYEYTFSVESGKTYQMVTDRLGQPLVSEGETVQPGVSQGSEPDWLGSLPGLAAPAEFAPEESALAATLDLRLLFGCGALLLILLMGGLLIVMKRSKRQSAQPAEDDWMDDLPSARAGAPGPAVAQYGSPGGHVEQSQWVLVAVDGPDAGKRFPLGAQARLGRSSDNDVHLADPQASRQHATIQRLGGDWVINDLGSSNGTFVGGTRIAGPTRLREGEIVRIGNTTLRLMISAAAPEPRRVPPSSPIPAVAPAAGGTNFCPNCGHSLMTGARFCAVCGASLDGGAVGTPAAYQPLPAPSSAPSSESVVGVLSFLERRKGLMGSEAFNLVLTADRLVFAKLTSDMLKAAVAQARQDAKAQGKGFFGQWGAQLGASGNIAARYFEMPVDAILRENPDNYQLPLQQIQKVQVKHGHYDEQQTNPDYLIIQAGNKMRFNLKGISAGEAKKALKQVLGDRVR